MNLRKKIDGFIRPKRIRFTLYSMMQGMVPPENAGEDINIRPKLIGIVAMLIVFAGIIVAWLASQGFLPGVDGVMVIGITIISATVIVCCASTIMLGSLASKMPEYGEMEIRFDEGMEHYGNEEWENALLIFTELAGPKLDHKRALYYAAKCYEKMDDLENVKKFCTAYLKIKPKDREVWELLASAHKKLFEYEEAQAAEERASKLPEPK